MSTNNNTGGFNLTSFLTGMDSKAQDKINKAFEKVQATQPYDILKELEKITQGKSLVFEKKEILKNTNLGVPHTTMERMEDRYILKTILAGYKKENVTIENSGDKLLITAVNGGLSGDETTKREFVIKSDMDFNKVTAQLNDGILTIDILIVKANKIKIM